MTQSIPPASKQIIIPPPPKKEVSEAESALFEAAEYNELSQPKEALKKADEAFKKMKAKNPVLESYLLIEVGKSKFALHEYEGAVKAFQEVISGDLDDLQIQAEAILGMAKIFLASGDNETAQVYVETGLDLRGEDHAINYELMDIQSKLAPTLLYEACIGKADLSQVQKLVHENSFIVDQRDPVTYETPLMAACSSNEKVGIAEFLLQKKADVNASNNIGQTALILAVEAEANKVVQMLMKHSPLVLSKKDITGKNALQIALAKKATPGNLLILKALVKTACCENIRDRDVAAAFVRIREEGKSPSLT